MKNSIKFRLVAALYLCLIFPAAFLHAQSEVEGKASVMFGSYKVGGVGNVSIPELGDKFHLVSVEAFQGKRAWQFGGFVRSYSRYDGHVLSAGVGARFSKAVNDHMRVKLMFAPVVQRRDGKSALGGAMGFEGRFSPVDDGLTFIIRTDVEVGNRGIMSDMSFALRVFDKAEARAGLSSITGGEYAGIGYSITDDISVEVIYVFEKAVNDILSENGYEGFHRRGLGFQAMMKF